MMRHGVSIDLYHAALLTCLVIAWRLWFVAGMRLGYRAPVVAAVVAVVALVVTGPYAALVVVLWVVFAWDGARQKEPPPEALARGFLWMAAKGNRS